MADNPIITIETNINVPVEKVWKYWTTPEDIHQWNNASTDWHTTHAENDLRIGGKFMSRMEAKDGSMGFNFGGTYDDLKVNEYLAYTLVDGRKVIIRFNASGNKTKITETFDAEMENSIELQRSGWQSILDNFRHYAERNTL
ncbi:SRPBCC family protein [soil metagenome]